MSKIMKVVYLDDKENKSWSIGDNFVSEWVRGKVTSFHMNDDGDVFVFVDEKPAMMLVYITVQRLYYGEG